MILVTGSEGLIGKELRKHYDAMGWDKLSGNDLAGNTMLNVQYHMVVHLAANDFIRDSIARPSEAVENIISTVNLFEHARKAGCKRIIVFSSSRVAHGNHNPYVASKRFLEEWAKTYHECYGIEYIIVRPETVWGWSNKNERVIMKWVRAAYNNEPITIYGDSDKQLAPVYVDDFMPYLVALIEQFDVYKGGTYSIAGEVRRAVDIVHDIKETLHSNSQVVLKPAEASQPQECNEADIVIRSSIKDAIAKILCEHSLSSDSEGAEHL